MKILLRFDAPFVCALRFAVPVFAAAGLSRPPPAQRLAGSAHTPQPPSDPQTPSLSLGLVFLCVYLAIAIAQECVSPPW